jgi:hypothetical protein
MRARPYFILAAFTAACTGVTQQDEAHNREPILERVITYRGTISLRQLPEWLERQNIDFVIADPEKLPNRNLSINVNRKALKDVLGAIGLALNGVWTNSGGDYALRLSPTASGPVRAPGPIGNPPHIRRDID